MNKHFPKIQPVVMTVAGSDSGGGAGIQADLRTFASFDVFGVTAITAVTAQNPEGVSAVQAMPADVVGKQMQAILQSFAVKAVKTGMLFNAEIIGAVVDALAGQDLPLVVDPVMVASSGAVLLQPEALTALTKQLLPRATVITPNLPEAEIILGRTIAKDEKSWRQAASEMQSRFGAAVVLKGGHAESRNCIDFLCHRGECLRLAAPRVNSPTSHGTGCCFSAAIAAALASGCELTEAVRQAKALVLGALRGCVRVGEQSFAMKPLPKAPDNQVEVCGV